MANLIERRLLTLPGLPVRLRKRRSKREDEEDDKDKNGDKPDDKEDDKKEDKDADDAADEEKEETDGEQEKDGKEDKDDDKADDKEQADDGQQIEGYAAVFHSEDDPGTEYELWSDPTMRAVERIARGAFSRAIREQDDVRALYNHDPNAVLGRSASGTLRMEEDQRGLRYEVDLPDTTLARDLATLVSRGDINGSSFGFVVEQESWRESEEEGGKRVAVRTIEGVRLLDVGPVTYPAYASTEAGGRSVARSVALGSVAEARASYTRWRAAQVDEAPLAAKLAVARARAVAVAARS